MTLAVPVIDIAGWREGADKPGIARAFGDALERTGFAAIVGHGIDEHLVAETYRIVTEFFALPLR